MKILKLYKPFLFILPGLTGFIIFFIWPFIVSLGYTVTDKPIGGSFVGLRNFTALLGNQPYLLGLRNTLIFIGLCVPLNMALSLGAGAAINKLTKYGNFFALIFLIPLVIPSGSMVFFWKTMFSYNGYANYLLGFAGISPINWFSSNFAMAVVILIFIWKNMGYNMILFISGLNAIPAEYYEAATVDGAGRLRTFFAITLPCLAPSIVLVIIMSIINSFKVFKEIYLLTGSYPHESIYMLQHFMNNNFFSLNYPRLATATTILVLAVTLIASPILRMERKALDA